MDRLRKLGTTFLNCLALVWFADNAITDSGGLQLFSILMLIFAAMMAGMAVLDRIRPRPKRRRSRERDPS
jgi:hypothetical protein